MARQAGGSAAGFCSQGVQNMISNQKPKLGACLSAFLGLACAAGPVMRQAAAQENTAHAASIGPPTREVGQRLSVPADFAKTVTIEPPTLAVVQHQSAAPVAPVKAFVNAHVSPGKVHWHATFADACRAAAKSGKPVLLFHMMGKLDDLFC
jgi:hypothetical protein